MYEGMLLVDKPLNWTSHDVVAKIRALTRVKKVGHAGTLDPLATGLLIVLVGKKFTKQQSTFLKQDKEYETTGELGITTDTYDLEGTIIKKTDWDEVSSISKAAIEHVISNFVGEISQTVPPFSSVKIKGKKLYELARKGEKIELPSRIVKIANIDLIDFLKKSKNKSARFSIKVSCSSGTYIRSLVHDIGKELLVGATVAELRRTKIGKYSVDNAKTIEELVEQFSN